MRKNTGNSSENSVKLRGHLCTILLYLYCKPRQRLQTINQLIFQPNQKSYENFCA